MKNALRAGTMLIADGIQMPEAFAVETRPSVAGWSFLLHTTSVLLNQALENAGWTLFYLPGEIRTRSFGFDDGSRTERALGSLVAAVNRERFNCLEVAAITRSSLLGLPFTRIGAHARHIQQSCLLQDASRDIPTSLRNSFLTYGKNPSRGDESIQALENVGGTPGRLDQQFPTLSSAKEFTK